MGWKEYGKYGVCTGRTVRSPFAHSKRKGSWNPGLDTETLFKFTRGTENLSCHELDEFLSSNDIDDGLGDFNNSNIQLAELVSGNVHYYSIFYSLKKRKRWTLPERCPQQLDDLDDRWKYSRNVTFIHRRVERKLKADCIAVHKTNRNEVLRSKRHSYARASDLISIGDETNVQPELCYEISYRYPIDSYPVHAEVHRVRDDSPWKRPGSKAQFKDKGAKNKGARWGFYSDAQIRDEQFLLDEEPVEMCPCEQRRQSFAKNKITIMNCAQFKMCKNANETLSTSNLKAHLLNGRMCFECSVSDSEHSINIEADTTLSIVHGCKVDVTEDLPLYARKKEEFVVSADINVETQQGVNSVNDFNLGTKLLCSDAVSGMPEYFTARKEDGEIDNATTPVSPVESVNKFSPGNVNINQDDTAISLDEMTSSLVVRINKAFAENLSSDEGVNCFRLPSPPKCLKPATRRSPRVRLRTQENDSLENGCKSSSTSSTEVERRSHSRALREDPAMRNTKKKHCSILPLKHGPPRLAQPMSMESSLQDLEIVGTKVSVQYHSHCSLQRLSETKNRIVAMKTVRRSLVPSQVSQRHVSVGEQRLKGAGSCQFPDVTAQPCIHKWRLFGNKCAIAPRHETLKWHKSVPCRKWMLQEPRILSLRPSFLPALHGRRCGSTETKNGAHRVQKHSFVESKQLTSLSKHDNLSSRVCSQDVRSLSGAQGITNKRRNSSTLRYFCRDDKRSHYKTEARTSPENRPMTLLLDYQIDLPFFSSNETTIDNEQRINMSSPVAACNVGPDESVNSGSVTQVRTDTELTFLPVILTKQGRRQKRQ